jgi:hypothetical protein
MNNSVKAISGNVAREKARLERIRSIELNTLPADFRGKQITLPVLYNGEQSIIKELNDIQDIIEDMHELESLSAEIAIIRGDYIKNIRRR